MIECSSFAGPLARLNGERTLAFSCYDLVWAAVTVGYPNFDHLIGSPSQQQLWADTFRIAIVYAFLDSNSAGIILKSQVYEQADGSEKGAISYYLGLFLTKLAADRLLDVPLLWHFDAYSRFSGERGNLRTRPDLVGCSLTDVWYIIEAKGRSRGFTRGEADRAKDQACVVRRVLTDRGPRTPQAKIASFAFFDTNGEWKMRWIDPEPELEISLDVSMLLSDYYRPIKLLSNSGTQETISINNREYFAYFLADVDAWIGAPREVIEGEFRSLGELRGLLGRHALGGPEQASAPRLVSDDRDGLWSISSDGIIVQLGPMWIAADASPKP